MKSELVVKDTVLLKTKRIYKSDPIYESVPYKIKINGSMITGERYGDGVFRNSSFFKNYMAPNNQSVQRNNEKKTQTRARTKISLFDDECSGEATKDRT